MTAFVAGRTADRGARPVPPDLANQTAVLCHDRLRC